MSQDRRTEGDDEVILDPGLAIVDAHFHLIDRPGLRYLLDDYVASVNAGHRIVAAVYVETLAHAWTTGDEMLRPLGEVAFAAETAALAAARGDVACDVAAAIVGHADLRHGSRIGVLLDRALEAGAGRFRGIRQVALDHPRDAAFRYIANRPPRGLLADAGFLEGFGELAPRGLSFDAAIFDTQLDDLGRLADRFPDTTIILNHIGFPMGIDLDADGLGDVFRGWRAALRRIAARPNVLCKIGGLGLAPWGLGFDLRPGPVGSEALALAWRPYVETGIEAFGPDRCMMASDFPPDARSCGFVPLWNAMKRITGAMGDAEKALLFGLTAAAAYRIAPPETAPQI